MADELLQLDISKLSESMLSVEQSNVESKKNLNSPTELVKKLFKNQHNVTSIKLSNKNIIDNSESLIKCNITREKINITIKTSIKIIEFDYLIDDTKCFVNSKEATNKQFDYFIKAMNKVISFSNNEKVIITANK